MSRLADDVLPLIRTRTDLHRWSAANRHGADMHEAIDALEERADSDDPAEVYSVTTRAIASAMKVIMRADDSSGVIGDACRRLLGLHPQAALAACVPPGRLVTWMMDFQFANACDYFEIDPVAYAPALGAQGMSSYRQRLADLEASLGPRPEGLVRDENSHTWFVLDWNARRLAVLDRDVDAIVRTHARDRKVAAWLVDTARALEEIGAHDEAIAWAREATLVDRGYQSITASRYWCELVGEHRPQDLLAVRLEVFDRWPRSENASALYRTAGDRWPEYADEVQGRLAASPPDAVGFALTTLDDVPLAWDLSHRLDLDDGATWDRLVEAYAVIDPLAVLAVMQARVRGMLVETDARHYRHAARRLATMRRLADGSQAATEVDDLILQLRDENRRRPRLQREFDRAGLPSG